MGAEPRPAGARGPHRPGGRHAEPRCTRLDVLLHVKWTVKEFDCNLTRELVDLIDREADMLNRGRPEKSFVGLRRRMANLFLQFIETPEFNPEAMRFQKVPRELHQQSSVHPLSTIPIEGLGQSA